VLAEERKSPSALIARNAPPPNHRLGRSVRLPANLLPRRTNTPDCRAGVLRNAAGCSAPGVPVSAAMGHRATPHLQKRRRPCESARRRALLQRVEQHRKNPSHD
jgi:hypothetical protein